VLKPVEDGQAEWSVTSKALIDGALQLMLKNRLHLLQLPTSNHPRARSSSVDVWVCLDPLPVFSHRFLRLLFSQPAVLQVTTLLLNLASVANAVDAASAGDTKSIDLNLPASDALNLVLDRTLWRAVTTASGLHDVLMLLKR